MTQVANGAFLNGVTRQRVIRLLRAEGKEVCETTLTFANFDELGDGTRAGVDRELTPRPERAPRRPGSRARRRTRDRHERRACCLWVRQRREKGARIGVPVRVHELAHRA